MFVVTLPRSAASNPGAFARKAKKAGADVLEIRRDLTPNVKKFSSPLPLLVAVRGKDRGLIERLKPTYIDVDNAPSPLTPLPRGEGSKVILSFHDYKKTPSLEALKKIAARMQQQKPWAIKVATTIRDYDDLLTLERLRASMKHPRVTILGMGEKAHLSRILSSTRNHLTYASLDGFEESAPGQLPMSLYALLKHTKHPKIFGIIGGSQVATSLSPVIQNGLFHRHKVDAVYSIFPTDDFKKTIKTLTKLGITGLSVTAPFKKKAFDLSKTKDPMAKKLGVVNTLVRKNGVWQGFNTDWIGVRDGYPFLKKARSVAILGAGGAVPSVIAGIRALNADASITIFARHPEKAAVLNGRNTIIRALEEAKNEIFDVVLCAVTDDVDLPLPTPASSSAIAIDVRYGKPTKFLKQAAKKGFRVYDGIPMLLYQALRQFALFTDVNVRDDYSRIVDMLRYMIPSTLRRSERR